MSYVETSEDFQDGGLNWCRVLYAAFLYDEYKKRKEIGHHKAIALSCRKAGVSGETLRQHLPKHNRKKRILRDRAIIEMRASGYSINLIAEMLGLHRCTVSRALDAQKSRVNAARLYDARKIRGRLKHGDKRLDADMVSC